MDLSCDVFLAGSRFGLWKFAEAGGRAGHPQTAHLGISILDFHSGLTSLSLLVENDFKSHCLNILKKFEDKTDDSFDDMAIANLDFGLAFPPCSFQF